MIPFRPSDPGFDDFKRGIQLRECVHGEGIVFPETAVWEYFPLAGTQGYRYRTLFLQVSCL